MPSIISSFKVFEDTFHGNPVLDSESERIGALKHYFECGGVVSVGKAESGWPALIYPSPLKIRQEIKKLEEKRGAFSAKLKIWEKKLSDAKNYHARHNIIKFSQPLYWRHKIKSAASPDYRKDAAVVKLPVHLSADPRWQPMIKTFLNDVEYRKQLTETVETSIVYEGDRKVARYANTLQEFRADVSSKKIGDIQGKVDELNSRMATLSAMLKWASET